MVDRPILRFPDAANAIRRTGSPRTQPRPRGPGRAAQGRRFQATFDGLAAALESDDPDQVLRQDPGGIAPERALVFVTAGNIQNFARAAQAVGLEVFAETDLEGTEDYPAGFEPAGTATSLARALYATIPTLDAFRRILSLWRAHQNGETAPTGAGPWWSVFNLLLELRPWGPEDRLTPDVRTAIEERLPLDENELIAIEFEIWPTSQIDKRARWRAETEQRIRDAGGEIADTSSISGNGFNYEAILARLPSRTVRAMLDDPHQTGGLVTLEGVQFILPQMMGQAVPGDFEGETTAIALESGFESNAPIRAAIFDGTPVAAHEVLDGGVTIEDIHDLVRLSPVNRRFHATAMASLILRGDLDTDGSPLTDTRIVCVPLLIDAEGGSWTPENKLFVDLLHTALVRLMNGNNALAPDVFVINFSIGISDMRYAGRISALARLIDWWAAKEGVLFVISAGNISDGLSVSGISSLDFERSGFDARRQVVRASMRNSGFRRTLLAPSEALNGITVGAVSKDLNGHIPPQQTGIISLEDDTETLPQVTSALGLGPHRVIKPDLLNFGGRQEIRARPNGDTTLLEPVRAARRTGLIAAAPVEGSRGTQKSRGTSAAAALTTRAILKSAAALTGEDGPYEGQELPRRDLALLTRALAINAARWPDDARQLYTENLEQFGSRQHVRAKEEVCRYFGYGVLAPELMQESPDGGVTLVGLGSIKKDQAQIFRMPLPPAMAGDRIPRSMRVTLAWFTPVNPARAQYRLAGLEAVAADPNDSENDTGWHLDLTSDGPDANMIKRGSVWSRRLVNRVLRVPGFQNDAELPICVQCRDTANGGLSPDDDIAFAIAVTLQIEADVQYDVLEEIEQRIRLRLRQSG